MTAAEVLMHKSPLTSQLRGLHAAITILNCRAVTYKETHQMKYTTISLILNLI